MENLRTFSQKGANSALWDHYEQPPTQQQRQDEGLEDADASSLTSSNGFVSERRNEPKPPTRKKANSNSQCNPYDIKPDYSYISLIAMSISQSPNKMLTLSEICKYIVQQFPYYRKRWPSWQGSIQYNLSVNDCFISLNSIKIPCKTGSMGSSLLWELHPASSKMFDNGNFLRGRNHIYHQLPQKPYADPATTASALCSPEGITSFSPDVCIPKHELLYGATAIPCTHTAGLPAASCISIFPDHQPWYITESPIQCSRSFSSPPVDDLPHILSTRSYSVTSPTHYPPLAHYQPGDGLTQPLRSYPPYSSQTSPVPILTQAQTYTNGTTCASPMDFYPHNPPFSVAAAAIAYPYPEPVNADWTPPQCGCSSGRPDQQVKLHHLS